MSRISDDELIDELQRLADELGETPKQSEMKEYGKFSEKPYKTHFGSWNEALHEAGFEPNSRYFISDRELISELKRLADELGKTPAYDDMGENGKFGARTYETHFDSWNEALREAGLENREEKGMVSEDKLIDELQRLANELGKTPTYDDMRENGKFGAKTYETHFDSWNEALRESGFEPNARFFISDEELLSELKELADELGETPTASNMDKYGKFGKTAYKTHFGSWNQALHEAGFEPNTRNNISDEELLFELKELADELGKTPSTKDMKKYGKFSRVVYQTRFGSWNQALREAGLDPIQEYPIETEWADGITDYYGQSWPEMRTRALDRDEHTCQACGATEAIHVHHITPRRCFENPDDSNTIENLISLCSRCHGRFEGQWIDYTYSEFKSKAQQSIDQ